MLLHVSTLFSLIGFTLADYSAYPHCELSSSGQLPPPGFCAGPLHRSKLLRTNLTLTNEGCPIDTIPHVKDSNPSAEFSCLECVPGSVGSDDSRHNCDIDEFCTDKGKCANVKDHPLWNAECPYDTGNSNAESFCGGLRCIRHRCLSCLEGTRTNGRVCINSVWRREGWETLFYTPTLLLLLVLVLGLYAILLTVIALRKRFSAVASLLVGDLDHEPPIMVGSKSL
ncbi:hypothetical protein P9112_004529 [Eukaryota sp. TZLM1-RC]